MPETLLFYLLAGVAVLSSALVIGQRNPMYSVMMLIGSFLGLAGLYILLDAPFVAMAQIIIYAGAIMVLFLFVVMLLNAPHEDAAEWDQAHPLRRPGVARVGVLLAGALVLELAWALSRAGGLSEPVTGRPGARGGQLGAGTGPRALHGSRVRVRGDVDPHPGGHGRGRRAGPA